MSNDLSLLKREEEVVEFLKNLGIQYRFGCYENKNPEACELLAEFVEIFEKNIRKSTKLYKFTCDQYGLGKSCHNYANSLFFGRGVNKDYLKSLDYYSKGCLQGYSSACFNAGQLYFSKDDKLRKVLHQDVEKASVLFEKGCLLKNSESCSLATYIYYTGFLGKKERDYTKAFEMAEKGCNLNELNSCVYLCDAYKKGLGVKQDKEKHEKLKEKVEDLIEQTKKNQTASINIID